MLDHEFICPLGGSGEHVCVGLKCPAIRAKEGYTDKPGMSILYYYCGLAGEPTNDIGFVGSREVTRKDCEDEHDTEKF